MSRARILTALVALCAAAVVVTGCARRTAQQAPGTTGEGPQSPPIESLDQHGDAEGRAEQRSASQSARIVSYDIAAGIDPPSHGLSATAQVRWECPEPVGSVWFDLRPDLEISEITVGGGPALQYSRDSEGRVTLPLPAGAGKSFTMSVSYAGVINGPRGGASNQRVWDYIGPEGTYVRFEAEWYPQVWGDMATADIRLTVPEDWTTLTSGQLVGQSGNEQQWRVSRPAAGLSFTAAQYVVAESRGGEIPIQCYTFERHRRRAAEFIEQCGEILALYQQLYGKYPFEKFAVAEIPDLYGGGHGDQGFIMLQERAFTGPFDTELVAHEMAHNWWGSLIQCTESEFLAEGFATYSQALWREHVEGPAGLQAAMREQAEPVLLASLEPEGEVSCFESESGPLLYEKGSWILHMLRHQVGDDRWLKTVRKFAEDHAGQVVTCRQFQAAFDQAYGEPLEWFFKQWLYGTEVPWVTGDVHSEGAGQVRARLHQRLIIGEGEPAADAGGTWKTVPSQMKLRVDVAVDYRGGRAVRTFMMNLPDQDFIFGCPGEPTGLVIDPDCWLLDHSKGLAGELDGDMRKLQEELDRELGGMN